MVVMFPCVMSMIMYPCKWGHRPMGIRSNKQFVCCHQALDTGRELGTTRAGDSLRLVSRLLWNSRSEANFRRLSLPFKQGAHREEISGRRMAGKCVRKENRKFSLVILLRRAGLHVMRVCPK